MQFLRHFLSAGFAATLYATSPFIPNNANSANSASNALLGRFHLPLPAFSRLATSGNGHAFQTHV